MNVEMILEKLDRSGLDAGARSAVLNAIAAGMTGPEPNGPDTAHNRHQYRAAASWMRKILRRQARRLG